MRWEAPERPDDLMLERVDGRLELRARRDPPGRGVHVDLGSVRRTGMRALPLARALGEARTVVDATAGLCRDAYLMALMGCRVVACERSPLVAAIARDGLERAARDPRVDAAALARLSLVEGDARTLLGTVERPDAVLLDPMFPARRKASALPGKDIRIVRAAAGDDPDAAELLACALGTARRRVLVKRADDAPAIPAARAPDLVFEGARSRVDVYLTREGREEWSAPGSNR